MTLNEYLLHAADGAKIIAITPRARDGRIVAHTWRSTVCNRPGWEYVLADHHGNILGQAWSAGGVRSRDVDIDRSIEKLLKRASAVA